MKKLLFIIMYLGFFSCTNKDNMHERQEGKDAAAKNDETKLLAPDEFVRWVKDEDHGLKKEKKIGDIVFSAQYKPVEYVICMEERSTHISDSVVKRKKSELGDMLYLDFKIALEKGEGELLKYKLSSMAEYGDRVNYFSFKMQNDIFLVDGNDTISCTLFHFERAYDAVPYSTFVLGFPNNNKAGNKTLIYHDNIFKKGIIKLEFENNNLKAVPK